MVRAGKLLSLFQQQTRFYEISARAPRHQDVVEPILSFPEPILYRKTS